MKDLKINVQNALNFQNLTPKETALIAYGVAINQRHTPLKEAFRKRAENADATQAELAEVAACVALMATNNVFYRFRHYTGKEYYETTPAGIKMSVMMNPVLGKEFFELLSLCISAINGCERCVTAHEQSVQSHGGTQARIYDALRLTAILRSLPEIL
jgi:alkyl hydroperoxide reductase subunit D